MCFKPPKGYDKVQTTIRIPEPMLETLNFLVNENNISLNKIIIQCIEFALNNIDENETDNYKNK